MRKLVSFFALALLLAPAPAAHGANLASIGDGYLLEAEAFDAKIPDDADFARPKKDAVASGGQTLLGFYVRERALRYDVVLPESGQYSIWLRYASNGEVRFSFSLNGAKDALRAVLPATGSLEGWEAYRWTRIYEGPLQAGALSLLAQSATMRPDCFLFSLSKEPPTHMSTPEHAARPMDEATLALLAKPIEPIRPDWIEGAKNYELPEWFDQWRVCAHTRLGPPWRDKPIFLDAAAPLASLGFHVFSRHIKTGKEGAWWPSRVGPVEDWARDRDWAREILDDAHRNGLRLIVYYRHMEDAGMAERHPDWVCVDAAGAPVETNRGAIMCLNSPYVDYLLERQLELAERGADGFYYDEVHMPKQGCWCSFCRRLFEERTGLEMPSAADPRDPVWQKLIEFKNATIERAFLKLRQGLHAANPEIVMLISGNSYPAMVENHTSHRLYRIADSFKTEFSLPDRIGNNRVFQVDSSLKRPESDVRIAMGYALARDAADGRPAHIWCHGLINEESAVYAAAGMIAHGCIANLDNSEGEIPNPALFQKAVALGNRVSPALAGTRPLYWALVHFSEEARNRRLPDDRAIWKEALYPALGVFQTLLRENLPVGLITDSQLEEGLPADCKLLFLPTPDELSEPMRQAVAAFEKRGGRVVRQRPEWAWHDPNGGQEKAIAAFKREIIEESAWAPVQVFGGPEKMHSMAYRAKDPGRLTVALCNEFAWVATGKYDGIQERLAAFSAEMIPPPCEGAMLVLRNAKRPKSVVELASGQALEFRETEGAIEIDIPAFEALAVLDVRF